MRTYSIMLVVLLAVGLLVFVGREVTSSQQTTPTFAGVSQEQLEEQGIHLRLPERANVPDTLPQAQARERATAEFPFPSVEVKDSVLAILDDTQPMPGYDGPVWVFKVEGGPGALGGRMGSDAVRVVDATLVFVNARTGDFLFSSTWGHEEPN